LRTAMPYAAEIKRHEQVKGLVGMRGEGERREAALSRIDAEFLPQLANQGSFRRFAVMHLAARELPQPCHRLALGPAGDEYAAVDIDQRHRRNKHRGHAGAASAFAVSS